MRIRSMSASTALPTPNPRRTRPLGAVLALALAPGIAAHAAPTLAQRAAAARAAAESATNACAAVRPFYWEIGDARGMLASGSVERAGHRGAPTYAAHTVMAIASASKWPFAAYVVQREHGRLTPQQISMLNFTSGYTRFRFCFRWQTVDGCLRRLGNGDRVDSEIGKFHYSGGHMQHLAAQLGLGAADNAALATAVHSELGDNIHFVYTQPQPAGGMAMDAASYARFLRGMMDGRLLLGRMLDADAVCADPGICPGRATYSPIPDGMGWYYGLGHWIEGTPGSAHAAYSSAGAFGFYPWISQDLRWYGIVARRAHSFGAGVPSARCGIQIRAAWMTGALPSPAHASH